MSCKFKESLPDRSPLRLSTVASRGPGPAAAGPAFKFRAPAAAAAAGAGPGRLGSAGSGSDSNLQDISDVSLSHRKYRISEALKNGAMNVLFELESS